MKKVILKMTLAGCVLAAVSCGDNSSNTGSDTDSKKMAKEENKEKFDSTSMEDDTKFMVFAADGGMMEVQSSKLAQSNAKAASVKDFAKMMVADHSKANDELMELAKTKNVSVPMTLSNDKQKKYNDLADKKGADFDKAYMSIMVDDHKDVVDAFKKESDKGNDAATKSWASGKVPTLEHHLEMAKAIKDSLK